MPWVDGQWLKDEREERILALAIEIAEEHYQRTHDTMGILQSLIEAERRIQQERKP